MHKHDCAKCRVCLRTGLLYFMSVTNVCDYLLCPDVLQLCTSFWNSNKCRAAVYCS